jgi:RNA polymerase sigma factor (sigma-70 family)
VPSTRLYSVPNDLVALHKGLVIHIAKRRKPSAPAEISLDDLISYGLVGLWDAAKRFDPEREIKFATYASPRIYGAMSDGIRRDYYYRKREVDAGDTLPPQAGSNILEPQEVAAYDLTSEVIRAAIERLPVREHYVILFCDILGFTHEEVARILCCPKRDISYWRKLGLALLRRDLKDLRDS